MGDWQDGVLGDRERSARVDVPIGDYDQNVDVQPGEELVVVLDVESSTALPKEALVSFRFEDEVGEEVKNSVWPYRSEVVGEFQYLEIPAQDSTSTQTIRLTAPERATLLRIRGVQWKGKGRTRLVREPFFIRSAPGVSITSTPDGVPLQNSSASFRSTEPIAHAAKRLQIEVDVMEGEKAGKAPLQVIFRNEEGEELLGVGDLPQSSRFGSFLSLEPKGPEPVHQQFDVEVPPGARSIDFHGVDWGTKSAQILGSIRVSSADDGMTSVWSQADLQNFDSLIVLDTTAPPLGHDTLALRPNNLAKVYSELGSAVVFFPFGSLQGYPRDVGEGLVQYERSAFDNVCSSLAKSDFDGPKVYICSSFPSLSACTVAERFKAAGWKIVYECRDDMEEFNRVGYSKWYHVQLERRMLQIADEVISVSPALDEKLVSLRPDLESHVVIPNGVNESVIASGERLRAPEILAERNESRTLGYVGHLTDSWFDWPLLLRAAKQLTNVNFEIVGHGLPNSVELPSNVRYLGPKTHQELLSIVRKWKGGLIPFANLPLTRSVDPNKIYEYQAWGLRTLSAPMGSVDLYPSTWVYQDFDGFIAGAKQILEMAITEEELAGLDSFVKGCSWRNRGQMMRAAMGLGGELR